MNDTLFRALEERGFAGVTLELANSTLYEPDFVYWLEYQRANKN